FWGMRRGIPLYDYRPPPHPVGQGGTERHVRTMRQKVSPRASDGHRGSPPRRTRLGSPSRKRLREQGGATAVEFALILPVLIIFVFGIIGFGLAFMQMQTIRGALREGGRAAATGSSADEVQHHAYESALGAIDSAGHVE